MAEACALPGALPDECPVGLTMAVVCLHAAPREQYPLLRRPMSIVKYTAVAYRPNCHYVGAITFVINVIRPDVYKSVVKTVKRCVPSSGGSGAFSLGEQWGARVLSWGHSIGTTTGFLLRAILCKFLVLMPRVKLVEIIHKTCMLKSL